MADPTPKLQLNRPAEGSTDWADPVNANFDTLDDSTTVSGQVPQESDVAVGQIRAYVDQSRDVLLFYVKLPDGKLWAGTVNMFPVVSAT